METKGPIFHTKDGEELEGFDELFEHAFPECYQRGMLRARPYEGQPHTDHGERGKTEIRGITFRDLRDCFIRACCLASGSDRWHKEALKGEHAVIAENDLYQLPWDEIDIVAVAQNLSCEVERLMGIYPNVPSLTMEDEDGER